MPSRKTIEPYRPFRIVGKEVLMPYRFNNMNYIARFKMVLIDENFQPDTPKNSVSQSTHTNNEDKLGDTPKVDNIELRQKIDNAIQDHLIIGVDSGQAYFRETDFVIDEIVSIIQEQQKALIDRIEEEVIGEYEGVFGKDESASLNYWKNRIKPEMRAKLNQIKDKLS